MFCAGRQGLGRWAMRSVLLREAAGGYDVLAASLWIMLFPISWPLWPRKRTSRHAIRYGHEHLRWTGRRSRGIEESFGPALGLWWRRCASDLCPH